MANDLTVVIPFLNEGDEVERTVRSVRETAGDNVDILLVNDASWDGRDYEAVARKYGTRYVRNEERQGVAGARDVGVGFCETRAVLLLDSHCRFYSDDWWKVMLEAVTSDPRAVYSPACRFLSGSEDRGDPNHVGRAGYIDFGEGADPSRMAAYRWSVVEPKWGHKASGRGIEDVPCVIGGAYLVDKAYYDRLHGLVGLQRWGMDEPYLSIKAWLEGGSCRLINDVQVGHIFRDDSQQPYPVGYEYVVYNKMVTVGTLFPDRLVGRYMDMISFLPAYRKAEQRFRQSRGLVAGLRAKYAGIFTRPFEFVLEMNRAWQEPRKAAPKSAARPPARGDAPRPRRRAAGYRDVEKVERRRDLMRKRREWYARRATG